MSRERAPEFRKSLDTAVVASHSELELIARMNIDDYGQASGENRVECTVDVAQVRGVKNRRIGRVTEQRRRFDRKAHVVETHRRNQRNVRRRGVRVEVRFRVIGCLKKPVTEIDSAPQACESSRQIRRFFASVNSGLARNS